MPDIEWVLAFLLLGSFVGIMAGLLGIGGGGIMVPMLASLFILQGFPTESVIHLALGTSMAAIIATSISSSRAHHLAGGVLWHIVKKMTPGILVGAFLSTFLVPYLSGAHLAIFFALFMAIVSIQLFLDKKPEPRRHLPKQKGLFFAGSGIGSISALVSIGGGTLTIPYLIWHNVNIQSAIGTSAAIALPISIAGTLGYVINGWGKAPELALTLGFVYLPAVLLISVASYITAPYGVKLAQKLPVKTLKKIFSVLLILLSIKMLIFIILS